MVSNKKLKEYLTLSMRKLRHRKGYGVHSPFAYSIITEVIEEKLPYYAYRRMLRTYTKDAPIAHKVACLLLRLANRFRCRNVVEIGCDGGYTVLPLILTDTRMKVSSLGTAEAQQQTLQSLSWLPARLPQVSFFSQIADLDATGPYDMIVINSNPFESQNTKPTPDEQLTAAAQLSEWIIAHSGEETLIFVKGIQIHHRQEFVWDALCDREDVSITMDLYDYGLAIRRPHFFKQHYVVAF